MLVQSTFAVLVALTVCESHTPGMRVWILPGERSLLGSGHGLDCRLEVAEL